MSEVKLCVALFSLRWSERAEVQRRVDAADAADCDILIDSR